MLVRMLLIGASALALATPVAAIAGSGGGATAHVAKHRRHHHHSHHGIPQHNGGDHDADNRGGPSDGDGRT
jgi:hypothetical protein